MQVGELMLTVVELASLACGLNELAIVLLMLTHGEASLMLLVLEVLITLWTSVTCEFAGV